MGLKAGGTEREWCTEVVSSERLLANALFAVMPTLGPTLRWRASAVVGGIGAGGGLERAAAEPDHGNGADDVVVCVEDFE